MNEDQIRAIVRDEVARIFAPVLAQVTEQAFTSILGIDMPHGTVIDGQEVPCNCGDASAPHDIPSATASFDNG
jgi:hypothetical protein